MRSKTTYVWGDLVIFHTYKQETFFFFLRGVSLCSPGWFQTQDSCLSLLNPRDYGCEPPVFHEEHFGELMRMLRLSLANPDVWSCHLWALLPKVVINEHFFGEGGTGVWSQGFALTQQVLYDLCYAFSPFCSGGFGDGVLWTFCLGWLQAVILLISASQVVWIISVSHQHLVIMNIFVTEYSINFSYACCVHSIFCSISFYLTICHEILSCQ
jgi:hypothetical protein